MTDNLNEEVFPSGIHCGECGEELMLRAPGPGAADRMVRHECPPNLSEGVQSGPIIRPLSAEAYEPIRSALFDSTPGQGATTAQLKIAANLVAAGYRIVPVSAVNHDEDGDGWCVCGVAGCDDA